MKSKCYLYEYAAIKPTNDLLVKSSIYYLSDVRKYVERVDFFNISDFKYENTLLSENEMINHLSQIYLFESRKEVYKASAYTTLIMRCAIHNNNVKYINKFIGLLDKKHLTSWSLIALLRSVSVCKNDVNEWADLLSFSNKKVVDEGLDPKIELYGL